MSCEACDIIGEVQHLAEGPGLTINQACQVEPVGDLTGSERLRVRVSAGPRTNPALTHHRDLVGQPGPGGFPVDDGWGARRVRLSQPVTVGFQQEALAPLTPVKSYRVLGGLSSDLQCVVPLGAACRQRTDS